MLGCILVFLGQNGISVTLNETTMQVFLMNCVSNAFNKSVTYCNNSFPCSFSVIILIDNNDEPLRNDPDLQCRVTFVMSTVSLSLGGMYSVVLKIAHFPCAILLDQIP